MSTLYKKLFALFLRTPERTEMRLMTKNLPSSWPSLSRVIFWEYFVSHSLWFIHKSRDTMCLSRDCNWNQRLTIYMRHSFIPICVYCWIVYYAVSSCGLFFRPSISLSLCVQWSLWILLKREEYTRHLIQKEISFWSWVIFISRRRVEEFCFLNSYAGLSASFLLSFSCPDQLVNDGWAEGFDTSIKGSLRLSSCSFVILTVKRRGRKNISVTWETRLSFQMRVKIVEKKKKKS